MVVTWGGHVVGVTWRGSRGAAWQRACGDAFECLRRGQVDLIEQHPVALQSGAIRGNQGQSGAIRGNQSSIQWPCARDDTAMAVRGEARRAGEGV
eukprot:2128047-Prymnesium_polylepis.1